MDDFDPAERSSGGEPAELPPIGQAPAGTDPVEVTSVEVAPTEVAPLPAPPVVTPTLEPTVPVEAAPTPDTRAAEKMAIAPASSGLAPYGAFGERGLVEVARATQDQLIDGLRRIVAMEGPMLASMAYQTYVRSSGGLRVGREIRKTLNQALYQAVRRGVIAQITDNVPGVAEKTVYLPGTPAVVVRERGPRALGEIPMSELRTLTDQVGVSGSIDEITRAVLDELGLVRLTEQGRDTIRAVLAYTWS